MDFGQGMNWPIIIVAALFVISMAYRLLVRKGVAFMSVHEVHGRLGARERLRLVDVRSPEEYRKGHLPGAINLPVGFLKTAAKDLDPKAETILYCQAGPRAMAAYRTLKSLGFEDVKVMEGGMNRWAWDVVKQG